MMKQSFYASLFALTICSYAHAGLSLVPQDPLTAGTTVVFDAGFLNNVGANTLDSIGPTPGGTTPLLFQISSPVTPPIPTFTSGTGDVTPNAANGWSFFFLDANFITPTAITPIPVAPGATEDFATVSVDIPASFAGDFTISLVNDIRFVGDTGTPLETVAAGTSGAEFEFTVAAIPEPSAFLLLGLLGTGFSGLQYYRRRKDS